MTTHQHVSAVSGRVGRKINKMWGLRGGGLGSLVKQEGVDLCSHERGGVVGIKFREDVAHVLSAQLLDYETEKPVEKNTKVNTFIVIIGLTFRVSHILLLRPSYWQSPDLSFLH